jgi:glycosyl transferase family 2
VHDRRAEPLVSVLMPTYRQSLFIRRALESLRAQTLTDWELIVINDGSDDDTERVLGPYLADPRVRYRRLERNGGLGRALNLATELARGTYLAYLPSDDAYYPGHLASLAALLDARPEVYLAYGGLRWAERPAHFDEIGRGLYWTLDREEPTLLGASAVGAEREALERARPLPPERNNLLMLVQAMHRRSLEAEHRWAPREEVVSDRLEPDFWWGLLSRGATFAYSGEVSAEWVAHAENRRHIIGHSIQGGLSRYRQHYQIAQGEAINWQPSRGFPVDQRTAYGRLRGPGAPRPAGGLKILLVGELGFNPERVVAFEEQGHQLYALWAHAEIWDTASTTPYGAIEAIPHDARWRERVREVRPDVIYALLNWQALPLIDEVLAADLDAPVAFHFKEGPFFCRQNGLWPALMRALERSDGQIVFNEATYEWYQLATDGLLKRENVLIMDGDLLKREWLSDDFSPKLSERDGQVHTVCAGRPLGLNPQDGPEAAGRVLSILRAGIHVHLYGGSFYQQAPPELLRELEASGLVHLHPAVTAADWVRELSQYDAAWCHVIKSANGGDLRRATWNDLNLPARLGTYAAAGLPWIMLDSGPSRVALNDLARSLDVGVFFESGDDLAAQLRDRGRLRRLTENMRRARERFSFDARVPELVAFFRALVERRRSRRG